MPEYKLSILVQGEDRGASHILGTISGGLGTLNIAMGNLIADGLKAATGALIEFGKAGLDVAMDYQSSLNMFQAVSGATDAQLAEVGARAKELGADMSLPATSAGDAAKAMTELAKAGLTVNQALAAGKGTLQLAAAGNLDEAQAAEIAANALSAFGLAGEQATMVADLFAAAANKSSLEVTDVADGFKMASAVFSAFQGPVVGSEKAMKDLTTAMALLGNVGIKGSDAGTSLKQMLLQLTGPSGVAKDQMKGLMFAAMGAAGGMESLDKIIGGKAKDRSEALGALAKSNPDIAAMGDIAYDASGKMRPLEEIIKLVTLATAGMADEQRNQALTTIFGADATRAIIGLMKAGPEAFAGMEAAISEQGAASELAGARMKGLAGAWEGFKSIIETLQLSIMEPLLGPLEDGVRGLAGAVAGAQPMLVGFVQESIVPAVQWVGQLLQSFIDAPDKVQFIKDAFVTLGDTAKQWILDALPGALTNLETMLGSVKDWIVGTGAPWLGNNILLPLGQAILGWIEPQLQPLSDEAGKLLGGLGTWLKETAAPWLGDQLKPLALEFVKWVGPAIGDLIVAAGEAFGDFLLWISGNENKTGVSTELDKLNPSFIDWVKNELGPALWTALTEMGEIIWGAISTKWYEAFAPGSLGEKIVNDMMDGMRQKLGQLGALLPGSSGVFGAYNQQFGVPGFASGVRNFAGGLALVGENGPELVRLPGGSDVIPAGATRGALAGAGRGATGASGPISINIYGATDPRETARQVREELIKLGKRNNGLGGVLGGYA